MESQRIERTPMKSLQEMIVAELFYERVRANLNLEELLLFDLDLRTSIDRALRNLSESPEERQGLAAEYWLRAWNRIGDEMDQEVPDCINLTIAEPAGKEASQ